MVTVIEKSRDLIQYFPDTNEGKLANQYMQFEFYMFKATRLMMDRRFDEAEQTMRELRTKPLTGEQTEHAERLLDAISNAKISQTMAEVAHMKAACRTLQFLLHRYHAEYGKYPSRLSLDGLNFGDVSAQNRIKEALSAIEDYQASDKGFSFVAVGKDGKSRIRVTESEIEGLK